ncbi:protein of unknown function [Haloechinothrix alba]|uniref:DUF1707 domain-containing protein n=1 Tax=Haloechinothrix alba TaxID=664784 RepID=A0A238VVR6_9PSEU|nr:DUF1707 domain-containing protein [Haloechinothrix alba]SNR38400.1 protein of unknown function [Haloechinothrix alba]
MDPDLPEFRISDADRQEALDALSEHVRDGRLDIDEYGERSARVTTIKTLGELAELFVDLPRPRPAVLDRPAQRREPAENAPATRPARSPGAWLASSAVPLSAILAIVLYFTIARGMFLVFLIPVAVALLVGAANGRGRPGAR